MRRNKFVIPLLLAAALFPASAASAHDLSITQALVVFKSDGTYLIDIRAHWDALSLGMPPASPSADVVAAIESLPNEEFTQRIEDLKDMLQRRIRAKFNDIKQVTAVKFPEYRTNIAATSIEPTILGYTARMEGRIPANATEFTFGMSRSFNVVQATIFDEGSGVSKQYVLTGGGDSPVIKLNEFSSDAPAASQRSTFSRYVILGFEHILPKGLDHILFVLGLFLLSVRTGPLLWQISAFTVAHSVTLALSMSGVASLSPHVVEPLIALSIAYVAIENLFTREMKPWRPGVVFAFGLLHGMGFAGVLKELGFPRGEFISTLIGFNLGVEFGQLAVVLLAFLAIGWFRNKPWYRKAFVIPLSLLIAGVGLYWTVERAFAGS